VRTPRQERDFGKGVVTGILGLLGAILLSAIGVDFLFLGLNSRNGIKVEQELRSPGSSYVAFRWYDRGGGGPGWCYQRIEVVPIGTRPDFAKRGPHYTFQSDCATSVKLSWTSAEQLQIAFATADWFDCWGQSTSANGKVKIEYALLGK
jgi:hypothetical protein